MSRNQSDNWVDFTGVGMEKVQTKTQGRNQTPRAIRAKRCVVGTPTAALNWGTVVLDAQEFAELETCMTTPQQPTDSILQGAALARRLYTNR